MKSPRNYSKSRSPHTLSISLVSLVILNGHLITWHSPPSLLQWRGPVLSSGPATRTSSWESNDSLRLGKTLFQTRPSSLSTSQVVHPSDMNLIIFTYQKLRRTFHWHFSSTSTRLSSKCSGFSSRFIVHTTFTASTWTWNPLQFFGVPFWNSPPAYLTSSLPAKYTTWCMQVLIRLMHWGAVIRSCWDLTVAGGNMQLMCVGGSYHWRRIEKWWRHCWTWSMLTSSILEYHWMPPILTLISGRGYFIV